MKLLVIFVMWRSVCSLLYFTLKFGTRVDKICCIMRASEVPEIVNCLHGAINLQVSFYYVIIYRRGYEVLCECGSSVYIYYILLVDFESR